MSECKVLDNDEMRRLRTRDADPKAYLAIRFWSPKGIKISINEKNDSTPYWLISSNRGSELIKAMKN